MNQITDAVTLAVVMACHNRRENTLSCLRALDQQTLRGNVTVEVFLLDDGSSDGTAAAVRQEFPNVQLLEGNGNLFWNRGMYEAFSAAIRKGFRYYLWLNDDSILYSHAVQTLLDTNAELADSGQECAVVGSAMQDPISGNFTYGGVRRHRSRWGRVKLERIPPEDSPIRCDASNGNCVLIPSSVVTRVGNLDPVYIHRWGDHDYCFRALQHGCSVWLAPGYLGTCKENPIEGTWEDTNLPVMERIRKLNSPRGMQVHDYVIYMRRHRGPWWPAHLAWPYIKIVLQAIKQ